MLLAVGGQVSTSAGSVGNAALSQVSANADHSGTAVAVATADFAAGQTMSVKPILNCTG